MLKPLYSRYNDPRDAQRWIKLKKDFIPGAGDTLDFHVIGASWQKARARELLGKVVTSMCRCGKDLTQRCSLAFSLHHILRRSASGKLACSHRSQWQSEQSLVNS